MTSALFNPRLRLPVFVLVCLALCVASAGVQAQVPTCVGADTLPPNLVGGSYARVTPGDANNLRSEPGSAGAVVGQIQPGEIVYVTTAPRCVEGLVWWQVGAGLLDDISDFGWTAGGADGVYWLEQVRQPMVAPEVRSTITAANAASLLTAAQVEFGLVSRLVWSADSSKLAVSTVGAVWLYDFNQPGFDPLRFIPNPADTNLLTDLAFNPAGGTLVAVGASSVLDGQPSVAFREWALVSQDDALTRTIDFPGILFNGAAAVSADGERLAAVNEAGTIVIYTPQDASPLLELAGHTLVGALRFSTNRAYLASAGGSGFEVSDGLLRLWDANTGAELGAVDAGANSSFGYIQSLTFSANDGVLAVVTVNAESTLLRALDVPAFAARPDVVLAPNVAITAPALNADGSLVFAGVGRFDANNVLRTTLEVYDTASGTLVAALPLPGAARQVAISPDGTLLAVAYADPLFWGPDRVVLYAVP